MSPSVSSNAHLFTQKTRHDLTVQNTDFCYILYEAFCKPREPVEQIICLYYNGWYVFIWYMYISSPEVHRDNVALSISIENWLVTIVS